MIKQAIQQVIDDVNEFYDTNCEYGVGFLDGVQSVCDELDIKYRRTIDNLILDEEV
jgi:hypothetical protein